jgi:hypothetical protein
MIYWPGPFVGFAGLAGVSWLALLTAGAGAVHVLAGAQVGGGFFVSSTLDAIAIDASEFIPYAPTAASRVLKATKMIR